MHTIFVLCSSFVIGSFGTIIWPSWCPPDEIWNDCAPWLPERTCQNRFPYHPGYDLDICYERCECDAGNGYIRDRISGECVIEGCCPDCPPYEIWNDCDSCEPEPTCQNPYPNCTGISCPLMCFPRCVCDIGYIREEISGDCVPLESCPCCLDGEIWNECASCHPELTCQNPEPDFTHICDKRCYERCECDAYRGFIRDEASGKCVPFNDCPCRCGPLEVFKECASPCLPERTCQYQFPVAPKVCILSCEQRCECDQNKGLIRDKRSGECIDIGKCEDRCSRNQFWGCRPCCPEATCDNPKPLPCTRPCPKICINECLCNQGYVRNTRTGECVLPRQCPRPVG
uniref:Zonadhesin-like isoform X1 n=1 Tax=Diabrotica virgifera virgifera TaxID=50390 RepID=A0A6P7GMM4_DIAVI